MDEANDETEVGKQKKLHEGKYFIWDEGQNIVENTGRNIEIDGWQDVWEMVKEKTYQVGALFEAEYSALVFYLGARK